MDRNNRFNSMSMWLISPVGLSTFLTVVGVLFLCIPPNYYSHYVPETDYMYLNVKVALLLIICWGGFLVGALFLKILVGTSARNLQFSTKNMPSSHRGISRMVLRRLYLGVIVANLLDQAVVASKIGIHTIISALTGGAGAAVQMRLAFGAALSADKLGFLIPMSMTILVWTFVERLKEKDSVPRQRRSPRFLWWVATLAFCLTELISMSRGTLLTFFLMLVVVYLGNEIKHGRLRLRRLIRLTIIVAVIILAFFLFNEALRVSRNNVGTSQFAMKYLLGYFVAPYNRLAALIDGILVYPAQGQWYYALQWFWDFPLLSHSLHFYNLANYWGLHFSNLATTVQEQYVSVQQAGLYPPYNVITAYGLVFADFRWLTFVYFGMYGFISQAFFRNFLGKSTMGTVVYAYVAVTILTWWGILNISSHDTDVVLFTSILLWIFEIRRANSHALKQDMRATGDGKSAVKVGTARV